VQDHSRQTYAVWPGLTFWGVCLLRVRVFPLLSSRQIASRPPLSGKLGLREDASFEGRPRGSFSHRSMPCLRRRWVLVHSQRSGRSLSETAKIAMIEGVGIASFEAASQNWL